MATASNRIISNPIHHPAHFVQGSRITTYAILPSVIHKSSSANDLPNCGFVAHPPIIDLARRLHRRGLPRRPSNKSLRIPRLHVDCPGTGEFAHQPLTGRDAGDDAAGGHALEYVLAVPGDEVAVVDDVAFAFHELVGRTLAW